jgi:hypothetical protein
LLQSLLIAARSSLLTIAGERLSAAMRSRLFQVPHAARGVRRLVCDV